MIVQKFCETVYISAFQFKAHKGSSLLDLFQGKEAVRFVSHITSYHIPEKVSCQSSLTGVDQHKTFIQFFLCLFRNLDMGHFDLLVNARHGGDVFQTGGNATYLILPAAACGHDLLHGKNMGIQVLFCMFNAHKLKDCFHTGCRKDR